MNYTSINLLIYSIQRLYGDCENIKCWSQRLSMIFSKGQRSIFNLTDFDQSRIAVH